MQQRAGTGAARSEMKSNALALTLIGAVLCVGQDVGAQTWPVKPIRFISPFAPAGGADITSRAIAQKLAEAFGRQVLVDNRGGAGGMIGAGLGAKAPPDGYTLVLGMTGSRRFELMPEVPTVAEAGVKVD